MPGGSDEHDASCSWGCYTVSEVLIAWNSIKVTEGLNFKRFVYNNNKIIVMIFFISTINVSSVEPTL